MRALGELLAGWPLVVSIAAAVTARGLVASRRRAALNEALHELRRPMQALALATGPGRIAAGGIESSLQLATVALERLDREVNGGSPNGGREPVRVQPLLESAIARWSARASIGSGALALSWRAGDAVVVGSSVELSQAFDNLIVNAIEHGGPSIEVEARAHEGRLRVAVADSGRASRSVARRETPADVLARLAGKRRRGHGLAVVRRTAAAHGGRFGLRRSEAGSRAVLELPLAAGAAGSAA